MHGNGGDITHRYEPDPRGRVEADRTVWTGAADDTDEITIRYPERTTRVHPRDDTADVTMPVGATQRRPLSRRPEQMPTLPRRIPAQAAPPARELSATIAHQDSDLAPISVRIGKGVTAPTRRRGGAGSGWRFQGRLTRVLAGLVTVALVGAVGWTAWQWWQRLHNKVAVASVSVAPVPPEASNGCDISYDIVGTITTNGRPGTISYQWLRSDGQDSGALKQSVAAGQTRVAVHLFWRFTGAGSMNATATLRILNPSPMDGAAQFEYVCP
jgi:hypothetical protein